jgi:hypothetical protein
VSGVGVGDGLDRRCFRCSDLKGWCFVAFSDHGYRCPSCQLTAPCIVGQLRVEASGAGCSGAGVGSRPVRSDSIAVATLVRVEVDGQAYVQPVVRGALFS